MKRLVLSLALVLVLATGVKGMELPAIPSDMVPFGMDFSVCSSGVPFVIYLYSKSKATGVIVLSTLDDVVVGQLWYENDELKRIIVKQGTEVKSYKTTDEFAVDYPKGLCWIIENHAAQSS